MPVQKSGNLLKAPRTSHLRNRPSKYEQPYLISGKAEST